MSKQSAYDAQHRMLRALVLAEAQHVCHWCGGRATTADHLVPVADGGRNVKENYVAACARCNSSRGQRVGIAKRMARHFTTSRSW